MADKKTRAPIRTLISLCVFLAFLQAVRWFLIQRISIDAQNTALSYSLAIIVLIALSALILALARFWRIRLYLTPVFTSTKDKIMYIMFSCLTGLLLLSIPFETGNFSPAALVMLLYSAVVLPMFEELLFRGYIWARLRKSYSPEITVCMVTALLFAVWRAGVGDVWLFQGDISAFSFVMTVITNAVQGLMVGLITGFVRLLAKNCVPGLLIHIILALMIHS